MKLYIQNAAERDTVLIALLHNGYSVRVGTGEVPGTKKRVSYIEYECKVRKTESEP